MKKNWTKPSIIALYQSVKSGASAVGAERVMTCGGAVTTPANMYLPASVACNTNSAMAPFICANVSTSNGRLYITSAAGDVTISQVCS